MNLECLLLKAAQCENYSMEYKFVTDFYGDDFDPALLYSGTSKNEPSNERITSHQRTYRIRPSSSHRKCIADHLLKRIPPNSE